MNFFLLVTLVVLAITECCLAGMMFKMMENPSLKPVVDKMCDNKTLIPSAQLTAIISCKKPPPPPSGNDKDASQDHEKHMKQREEDRKACCPEERIASLKGPDTTSDQIMVLSLTCDSECGKCLQHKWMTHRNESEAAGHKHPEPTPEQKAEWEKNMNETTTCMIKAIGM